MEASIILPFGRRQLLAGLSRLDDHGGDIVFIGEPF